MLSFSTTQSIAIIGASEDPKKIGNILLAKNQDFGGTIYGINPKGGEAYGKPFYKSISELPEVPDIAVYAIPEAFIYSSLEEAGKCGVKKAIIITAGFKEVGNSEGEKRLQDIAKQYNIRILGPNCLGFSDTHNRLNLSFGSQFFEKGNIGIISQSGAMAVAITDVLAERGLGFSSLFSLGNKSDIDESDLLRELSEDPHTDVIALYLENISRGKFFIETLQEVTKKKPVIIMLGGVSEKGKQATASHTGSLSGDKLILEAAIHQGGGMLTYSLSEYFDLIDIFSRARADHIVGQPIIVTNAGGPGVLMTDQCDLHSIVLENFTPEDDSVLREGMPTTMSTKNPVDIIGDADSVRVSQVLENITKIRKEADIIFIFTVQATTDMDTIAERIIDFDTRHPEFQPYVCLIGGETVEQAQKLLTNAGIFVTNSTEAMARAYGTMTRYYIQKTSLSVEPGTVINVSKLKLLSPEHTQKLLESYSIPTTTTKSCMGLKEVLEYANIHNPPFVMKVSGAHIAHKTDMDGVQTDIKNEADIRKAYEKIQSGAREYYQNADTYMVTMERQVRPSPKYEFFFGAKRDPNFGDTFVIGTGGIYLSVINDTRVHIGIPSRANLLDILSSLQFAPVFSGYRGQIPINRMLLLDTLLNTAKLFSEHPEIQEIDINPILFDDGKPIVVDAKLYV